MNVARHSSHGGGNVQGSSWHTPPGSAGSTSDESPSAVVATPSWLAPRRASMAPVPIPVSAPPPRIIEMPHDAPVVFDPARGDLQPSEDLAAVVGDLERENAALRAQLAEQALTLASLRRDILAATEPELLGLACAIGEKIAMRELRTDPHVLAGWVQQALAALATQEVAVLIVGSDLADQLATDAWRAALPPNLKVEEDEKLAPWGCALNVGATRMRLDIKTRVASIVDALGLGDAS